MRTVLLTLATLAASTALHVGAAQAQVYPFCLLSGPGPGDCKYTSYDQCQATASGTGKYCQPNYARLPSYGSPDNGYGPGYAPAPRGSRAYGYGPQY